MRVVVDGQVTGADGIARCTHHLAGALTRLAPEVGLSLTVVPPSTVPRYSRAEGDRLLAEARRHRADVLHLLDYRIPLAPAPLPLVATVHDLLRLRRPQHCYTDQQFAQHFGLGRLELLREATETLRTLTLPPGAGRAPVSWHEEFYGLMTAYTAATAASVLTPTRAVAADLAEAVGRRPANATVVPWGIDHLPAPDGGPLPAGLRPGRYVLYVGQARSHKGLDRLLGAYRTTSAALRGIRLALAGRDFTPGFAATTDIPMGTVLLGEVDDIQLARLYQGAAALVHLTEHEGFGFPPLEAFRCGTRVLAADLPVLRETLHGYANFTDPSDQTATAHDLDRLLDTPDTAQQRWLRAAWAARYRWDTCARQVIDCYRNVLA